MTFQTKNLRVLRLFHEKVFVKETWRICFKFPLPCFHTHSFYGLPSPMLAGVPSRRCLSPWRTFFVKLAGFLLLGTDRSRRTGHENLKPSFLCSLTLLNCFLSYFLMLIMLICVICFFYCKTARKRHCPPIIYVAELIIFWPRL